MSGIINSIGEALSNAFYPRNPAQPSFLGRPIKWINNHPRTSFTLGSFLLFATAKIVNKIFESNTNAAHINERKTFPTFSYWQQRASKFRDYYSSPFNTQTVLNDNGIETIAPDGSRTIVDDDGIETIAPDGSRTIVNDDGIETIASDGSRTIVNDDGIETIASDGSRTIVNDNGVETVASDGSRTILNGDARKARADARKARADARKARADARKTFTNDGASVTISSGQSVESVRIENGHGVVRINSGSTIVAGKGVSTSIISSKDESVIHARSRTKSWITVNGTKYEVDGELTIKNGKVVEQGN